MGRSGYHNDCIDDTLAYGRYRGQVANTIRSKRGQAFLKELAVAMDAMPEKRLIKDELISASGEMCTLGVICKARSLDVKDVDVYDADEVGNLVGIARQMAAEIEYENDEGSYDTETPEQRWVRMRKWVQDHIKEQA